MEELFSLALLFRSFFYNFFVFLCPFSFLFSNIYIMMFSLFKKTWVAESRCPIAVTTYEIWLVLAPVYLYICVSTCVCVCVCVCLYIHTPRERNYVFQEECFARLNNELGNQPKVKRKDWKGVNRCSGILTKDTWKVHWEKPNK